MVYGTYNYSIHGVYKPSNITGNSNNYGLWYANNELVIGAFVNQLSYLGGATLYDISKLHMLRWEIADVCGFSDCFPAPCCSKNGIPLWIAWKNWKPSWIPLDILKTHNWKP